MHGSWCTPNITLCIALLFLISSTLCCLILGERGEPCVQLLTVLPVLMGHDINSALVAISMTNVYLVFIKGQYYLFTVAMNLNKNSYSFTRLFGHINFSDLVSLLANLSYVCLLFNFPVSFCVYFQSFSGATRRASSLSTGTLTGARSSNWRASWKDQIITHFLISFFLLLPFCIANQLLKTPLLNEWKNLNASKTYSLGDLRNSESEHPSPAASSVNQGTPSHLSIGTSSLYTTTWTEGTPSYTESSMSGSLGRYSADPGQLSQCCVYRTQDLLQLVKLSKAKTMALDARPI